MSSKSSGRSSAALDHHASLLPASAHRASSHNRVRAGLKNGTAILSSGPLIANDLGAPTMGQVRLGALPDPQLVAMRTGPARMTRSSPGTQLFNLLKRLRIPRSASRRDDPLPTSGYPATGKWAVQMGEHPVVGGLGGHTFLNVVNPKGDVVFQVHGYQVERDTGQIDRGGFGKPLQLMPFAYLGNQINIRGTVLHPPLTITNQRRVPEMLDRVLRAADRIYERNVEYYPVTLRYEAQNSNSVTNTLGKIMAQYAPGLSNDNAITYYNTPGDDRDLVSGRLLVPNGTRDLVPTDRVDGPRMTHRQFDRWRRQYGRLSRLAEVRHRYPPGVDPYNPDTFDPAKRPPRHNRSADNNGDTRMVMGPPTPPSLGPRRA
ncbi:MAG: hypothetical protein AAF213_02360 [Pseudomonadota bacterium]